MMGALLPSGRDYSAPGDQGGDLSLDRRGRGVPVVDGDVRDRGDRIGPDALGELVEVRQLARITRRPACGQPGAEGGRVRPDPDQVDALTTEGGDPRPPPPGIVDLA